MGILDPSLHYERDIYWGLVHTSYNPSNSPDDYM